MKFPASLSSVTCASCWLYPILEVDDQDQENSNIFSVKHSNRFSFDLRIPKVKM